MEVVLDLQNFRVLPRDIREASECHLTGHMYVGFGV